MSNAPAHPLDFLRLLTPPLRSLIDHYGRTLSEDSLRSLVAHLRKLHAGFHQELSRHPAGPERARATHRLIEAELTQAAHVPHSCSKGCGACCHLEVEITQDDGDLLAQLVLDGHPIDRGRLERQAARERKGPEWEQRVVTENRCVFLGADQACSIYENRPAMCRKTLVSSPAIDCSTPGANLTPMLIPVAELIMSTAISLDDNPFASLSKCVSRGLGRFGDLKARSLEIDTDPGAELAETPLESPLDLPLDLDR